MTGGERKRRVGIYVRVSADRTGEETSTDRQEADCRDLCRLKGWRVVNVYRDTDTSAFDSSVERPRYADLLADLEGGRIDTIVIWKLDRLARRTREVLDVVDRLLRLDASLISVHDPGLDTTGPVGRFTLTIMAAVAELESEQISLRVKRRKMADAMAGKPGSGGTLPFGWRVEEVERESGTGTKTVRVASSEVDQVQAEALRDAVRWLLDEGWNLTSIVNALNDRGVRTHTGKRLRVQTLRNMLTSPRLAGYRGHKPTVRAEGEASPGRRVGVTNLYPGGWEPIIDRADLVRLQEHFGNEVVEDETGLRLIHRGTEGRRVSGNRHLLTGLIWCGSCGTERMRAMASKNRERRYLCHGCSAVTVAAEVVEEHVVRETLTLLMGRRMLGHDEAGPSRVELEANLSEVEDRLRRLSVAHFVDRRIEEDEYEVAREELHERRLTLRGRLHQVEEMEATALPDDVRLGFDEWWGRASYSERRRVLDGAVERVTVAPLTHEVTDRFRIPVVKADPNRSPLLGVPKSLWPEVSRARVAITWRREVLPEPVTWRPSKRAKPPTPVV